VRTATRIEEVRAAIDEARSRGEVVGLVPTMGALHEGHLSLVRVARDRAGYVVLSVFVNPAQFAPGEDFEEYPRDLETDAELARAAGVDLLFAPSAAEMYPSPSLTQVRVEEISEPLCGQSRPGHFDGVALVVTKLLDIVRPDVSVFGQKDAQQAILIRRLVADLNLPGEVIVAPTVRERNGLAVSSRNRYLSPEEREAAGALSRGLFAAEEAYENGERAGERLLTLASREIEESPLLELEYAEIRDRETLAPWPGGEVGALLAVAVRVGQARLIDNVFLGGPHEVAAPPAAIGRRNA
jgi:pantoate--beta-alanine ligase